MNDPRRTRRISASVTALAAALLAGCAGRGDAVALAEKADVRPPSIAETRAIAAEGFVYGLPIVMNYAVMYAYAVDRDSGQFKAPFNRIFNEARVFTYEDTAIVTPNSDTPYSFLWMDLRAEPMVLSVPQVEKGRYYAVQLEDGNTFTFGYIGSRATGNEAGDYMVVGPDWKGETPPGIRQVFRASTQFALAGYRTQLFDPADMPNVVAVQSGYEAQPLSAYLKQQPPPPAPVVSFPRIDEALVKTNFFAFVDFALQFAPPAPEEKEIRAKLASIGIGPGKTFDFEDLSLEHKLEIGLGMKDGEAKVAHAAANLGKDVNGWKISSPFGDRSFFNGDWLLRAAACGRRPWSPTTPPAIAANAAWRCPGERRPAFREPNLRPIPLLPLASPAYEARQVHGCWRAPRRRCPRSRHPG